MVDDETEDLVTYLVVVNDEEQYSLWPADRAIPPGWREEGTWGSRRDCLDHIDSVLDRHATTEPAAADGCRDRVVRPERVTEHPLPPRTTDVWFAVRPQSSVLASPLATVIPREERLEARKFADDELVERFLFRRAVLRTVLARYLGESPQDLRIERVCPRCGAGNHGKPSIRRGTVRFSSSSAGDLVAIAVSDDEVGIDVETLDRLDLVTGLAQQILSSFELSVGATPPSEIDLLHRWTGKEAAAKACGGGLTTDPREIVVVGTRGDSPRATIRETTWLLTPLEAPDGFVGAVATRHAGRLAYHTWQKSVQATVSIGSRVSR